MRFDLNEQYSNYHKVEQLIHVFADVRMQHDWKTRCPRQLSCMQALLRQGALRRTHYDGDAVPMGEYTLGQSEWERFSSGCEDPSVLRLPPERCNEGMPAETSARTCAELQAHHTRVYM